MPRLSPSRAALDPESLPFYSRACFDGAAEAAARCAGDRAILAVTGHGGAGKSVLLGAMHDRVAAAADAAVVLVACGDVTEAASGLRTAQQVDEALGRAAGHHHPLTAFLDDLSDGKGATLLLDTADLLLADETATAIALALRWLVDAGHRVVLTCRRFEFESYLRDTRAAAPALAGLLQEWPLPPLERHEIDGMARAYVADPARVPLPSGHDRARHADVFAGRLLAAADDGPAVQEVLASPLLLGLVCELFAADGELPDGLTAHRLYDEFWARRVDRSHGRRDDMAAAKNAACHEIAGRLLAASSTRLVDAVPGTALAGNTTGRDGCLSEGVLAEGRTGALRFFHQTFGEFAMARRLEQQPDEEVLAFVQAVSGGKAHLWPVLRQLLLALDQPRLEAAVSALDLSAPEAMHAAALAAASQRHPRLLQDLTARAVGLDADAQRAVLRALEAAVEPAGAAAAALALLQAGHVAQANQAARSLGRLALRVPHGGTWLADGIEAAASFSHGRASRRRHGPAADHVATSLLQPLLEARSERPDLRKVLRDRWSDLDVNGRHAAAALHESAAEAELDELFTVALGLAAPAGESQTAARLLAGWQRRRRTGLAQGLQDVHANGWEVLQTAAAAHRAAEDPHDLKELVDEVLAASGDALTRACTAGRKAALASPAALAAELLSRPAVHGPRQCSAIASLAAALAVALSLTDRLAVYEWLRPAADRWPDETLPALARIGAAHEHALTATLVASALARTAVRVRTVEAALTFAPDAVLTQVADHLRNLIGTSGRLGAKLNGRLAETDPAARRRLLDAVMSGDLSRARTAVVELLGAYERAGDWEAETLAEILNAPSQYAAQSAAVALNAGQSQGWEIPQSALTNAAERLSGVTEQQLTRRLVDLLVGAAARGHLGPTEGRRAADALRARTRVQSDGVPGAAAPAAAEAARLLGALAGNRRLPREEARTLLVDFVASVDVGTRGSSGKALADALISAGKADAALVDAVVAGWEGMPDANQRAVVDAVAVLEGDSRGGRLDTLAVLPSTSVLARHRAQLLLGP